MKSETERQLRKFFNVSTDSPSPIWIHGAGRADLAKFYEARGFKIGAEIGVRRGEHAELMCRTIPGLELLCVDPWTPQPDYLEKTNTESKMQAAYDEASSRLAGFKCQFIQHTSAVAVTIVSDHSLDFAFIDGNHRKDSVLFDVVAWSKKIRPGGILAGHDYVSRPDDHIEVKDAVDAYTEQHRVKPWFVLSGVKGDKMPTWLWVE